MREPRGPCQRGVAAHTVIASEGARSRRTAARSCPGQAVSSYLMPVRMPIWNPSSRCAAASSGAACPRSKIAIRVSRPCWFHRSSASRDWASPAAQKRSAAAAPRLGQHDGQQELHRRAIEPGMPVGDLPGLPGQPAPAGCPDNRRRSAASSGPPGPVSPRPGSRSPAPAPAHGGHHRPPRERGPGSRSAADGRPGRRASGRDGPPSPKGVADRGEVVQRSGQIGRERAVSSPARTARRTTGPPRRRARRPRRSSG